MCRAICDTFSTIFKQNHRSDIVNSFSFLNFYTTENHYGHTFFKNSKTQQWSIFTNIFLKPGSPTTI